jgi:uncharacterized membrane protein
MKISASLVLLILVSAVLMVMLQIQIVTIAFGKLGLSPHSAMLWLVSSLLGSMINLPITTVDARDPPPDYQPGPLHKFLRMPTMPFSGRTVIAVNVGGCVVPVAFSVYLLTQVPLNLGIVLTATGLVSLVCYFASRPVPGLGIAMPIFIAPVAAALCATLLGGESAAALAYVCGTLGVLLGADLMRLRAVRFLGAPVASIGGAGTFDGIFVTGLVAVLLA